MHSTSQLFNRLAPDLFSDEQVFISSKEFVSAYHQLPEIFREVLQLRYVEEFTVALIALELNITNNKVIQHLHQAKAQLRRALCPEYYRRPLRKFIGMQEASEKY